ncbi:hypothetical protein ACFFP0_00530 [Rhizobium puerariae]|uniref:Uncharacterized protein n=1 Tax=Rhizobium puerariae TaxID=1585791 RepID=A0ABV6A9V1_9HYPH
MLYIFRNHNGVQIAWNARASRHDFESRTRQIDTRLSRLGFIRTSSPG